MNHSCGTEDLTITTLHERCQYLQEKLSTVENENYKLKLQIGQGFAEKSPRCSNEVLALQEKVALLTRENSQLTHQVQMVTRENKTLWARLSRVTSVNQTLGNRLSMISDTLTQHENVSKGESNEQTHKESLEEISLKLIQGILLEKSELESQYAQMADLQNANDSYIMGSDTIPLSCLQQDDMSAPEYVSKHVSKLNEFKQNLIIQQTNLQNMLATLKNVTKWKTCSKCVQKCESVSDNVAVMEESPQQLPTLPLTEIAFEVTQEGNNQTERICPMCGITFTGLFPEFQNHVVTHFGDEEDQDINTFELVT